MDEKEGNSLVDDLKLMYLAQELKDIVASERKKALAYKDEFESLYNECYNVLAFDGKELGTDVDENGDEYTVNASVYLVIGDYWKEKERIDYFYDNVFVRGSEGDGHYIKLMSMLYEIDKYADEIMDSAYNISIKKAEIAKLFVFDSMKGSQWSLDDVMNDLNGTEIDNLLVAAPLLSLRPFYSVLFGVKYLDLANSEVGTALKVKNYVSGIIETAGFSNEEKKKLEQILKDYHDRKGIPNGVEKEETVDDAEQLVTEDGSEQSENGKTEDSTGEDQSGEESDVSGSEESTGSESNGEETTEENANDGEESEDDSDEEKEDSDEEKEEEKKKKEKEESDEEKEESDEEKEESEEKKEDNSSDEEENESEPEDNSSKEESTSEEEQESDDEEPTSSTDSGGEKPDIDNTKPEEKQPSQSYDGDEYTSDDSDDDYETGSISITNGSDKHSDPSNHASGGYYDNSSSYDYSSSTSSSNASHSNASTSEAGAEKGVIDLSSVGTVDTTSSSNTAIISPQGDAVTPSVLGTTSGSATTPTGTATTTGGASAVGTELNTVAGGTSDLGTQVTSGSAETVVTSSPSETVVTSSDDSYSYGGQPAGYSEYESIPDTGVDMETDNKRGNMFIPTISGALLGAGLGMVAKNIADKEKEEDEDNN